MLSRRNLLLAGTAVTVALGVADVARAEDKTVKVGINLSFTGADAESAARIKDGALMAFDEANAKGVIPGYTIEPVLYDDGTATAGQYDPAQAATNARKMVSDKLTMAAIGPQMSGAGKAMAPILSEGDLAIITPSSTNPDLTDPKFAAQYRPAGKAIYFRTVTTDAFQGPNMANYYAEVLKVPSVYMLDDGGAYGVGLADAFQGEAEKKGIKILGRDRLDPKAADYRAVLTKIKALNAPAIYYGGVLQAGVKLAKQAYEIIPDTIKAGGDGVLGPEMLTAVGFPAAEGWYATNASPHMTEDPAAHAFVEAYTKKYGFTPDDYAICAYDGALVIIDAIKRVAASGKPVTRDAVRDAIQDANVKTLQGVVSFDDNGDVKDRTVSIFQIKKDTNYPLDDILRQYHFVGVAPQA
jgi:branched-chain amino acid transport system substrate-binding protein